MKCKTSFVVGVGMVALLAFGAMAQDVTRVPGGSHINGTEPQAAPRPAPDWIVPASSVERSEDAGLRMHTNIVFRSLDGTNKPTHGESPAALAAIDPLVTVGRYEETPQSLGCIYLGSPSSAGCLPNYSSGAGGPSAAGWGAIAVVEAGDDSSFFNDMSAFDSYWGLPGASLVKIEMRNSCSKTPDCSAFGWCGEDALDSEFAHVYASKAAIVMVEACSSSTTDLLAAETEAFNYIATNFGGGTVSNSFGGGEFSSESSYDSLFTVFGNGDDGYPITAFASAGDSGCGAAWPSSNPWLTSAGGTSIYRLTTTGHFKEEGCWSGSGGGVSSVETMGQSTDYQYPMCGNDTSACPGNPSNRLTPDFAFNSDPDSGVDLYQGSFYGGWTCCWGGTSEASPSLAAVVDRSNNRLSSCYYNPFNGWCFYTNAENNLLYSQLPTYTEYKANFYDITPATSAGVTNGCTVAKGWDYCTGVGSPRHLLGK
jgi:kumamolisin